MQKQITNTEIFMCIQAQLRDNDIDENSDVASPPASPPAPAHTHAEDAADGATKKRKTNSGAAERSTTTSSTVITTTDDDDADAAAGAAGDKSDKPAGRTKQPRSFIDTEFFLDYTPKNHQKDKMYVFFLHKHQRHECTQHTQVAHTHNHMHTNARTRTHVYTHNLTHTAFWARKKS